VALAPDFSGRPPAASGGGGTAIAVAVGAAGAVALAAVFFWPAPQHAPPKKAAPQPSVAVRTAVLPRPDGLALGRGLIGYWTFDDGQGSLSARDHSGNANHCVLRQLDPAADWTQGPLGGAIALHDNGWLECGRADALARLTEEITISLWIKRTGQRPHVRALVSRQLGRHSLDHFHFGFSDDQLVLRSRAEGKAAYTPFAIPRGQWTHVAATRSRDGTARLFVDGEEVRSKQSDTLALGGGTTPLIIGGGINSPSGEVKENLEGVIDELLIYDRALAGAEIAALASRIQPR
jgi:hypothetical protein